MAPEAVIRATCGAVCIAASLYGGYKAYKFISSVGARVGLAKEIERTIAQLHVADSTELDADKLREFMSGLQDAQELIARMQADFHSVTKEQLLSCLSTVKKMFIVFNLKQPE